MRFVRRFVVSRNDCTQQTVGLKGISCKVRICKRVACFIYLFISIRGPSLVASSFSVKQDQSLKIDEAVEANNSFLWGHYAIRQREKL